jgi:hypothetical protein
MGKVQVQWIYNGFEAEMTVPQLTEPLGPSRLPTVAFLPCTFLLPSPPTVAGGRL